jgi:transcriptional regulator
LLLRLRLQKIEGAMYTPTSFKQEDRAVLSEAMRRIGFVSLVTTTREGLVATQAPVLFDGDEGEHGVLRGHIARANSQWASALPDTEGLAIFTGPHAYISPQWYAAKREHGRVVPTWNYVAVHAYGRVSFSDDRDLLFNIVTRLTEQHESSFEQPWKVSDAPAEYIESMLKAIVAFEMKVSRIEGSWKLSQNRSQADRAGVITGLQAHEEKLLDEMEQIYRPNGEVKSP